MSNSYEAMLAMDDYEDYEDFGGSYGSMAHSARVSMANQRVKFNDGGFRVEAKPRSKNGGNTRNKDRARGLREVKHQS